MAPSYSLEDALRDMGVPRDPQVANQWWPDIVHMPETLFIRAFVLTTVWDHTAPPTETDARSWVRTLLELTDTEVLWMVHALERQLGVQVGMETLLANLRGAPETPRSRRVPFAGRAGCDLANVLFDDDAVA